MFFGKGSAPTAPPTRPIRVILEEQKDVIIQNTTMSEQIRQIADRCSTLRYTATKRLETIDDNEKQILLGWSKIDANRIEEITREPVSQYINTAAIAINLLLEYGFKPRDNIIHYWQIIETAFFETQLKV